MGKELIAKGLAVASDGTGGRRSVDWEEIARRPGTTVQREVLREIEASEKRLAQRGGGTKDGDERGEWGVFR